MTARFGFQASWLAPGTVLTILFFHLRKEQDDDAASAAHGRHGSDPRACHDGNARLTATLERMRGMPS